MAKKLVMARKGAHINLRDGVDLGIPAGALSEDKVVTWRKVITDDKVEIHLIPDGLKFSPPAVLEVTKQFLNGIGRVERDLFGPDDKEVPGVDYPGRLQYDLNHFSIYYYRRR